MSPAVVLATGHEMAGLDALGNLVEAAMFAILALVALVIVLGVISAKARKNQAGAVEPPSELPTARVVDNDRRR